MDELIDIVDENGSFLGETSLKSRAHRLGLWHTSVDVWLYTTEGEILIQKRAADKDTFPNRWDVSVAGHIAAGEEHLVAAQREVLEELGLKISLHDFQFIEVFKIEHVHSEDWIDREFHYVYIAELKETIDDLKLQEEEVSKVNLIPLKNVRYFINNMSKKFVPYPKKYVNLILEKLRSI
jgi:isopentenyldiphosphate isomerase